MTPPQISGSRPSELAEGVRLRSVLAREFPIILQDELAVTAYSSITELVLNAQSRDAGVPVVLGLCGPQGSGKSTMASALTKVFGAMALTAVTLSLDDLYLSRDARARLARDVHPLLITRGVPGTHDVDLGIRVIEQLADAAPTTQTAIPRFDKALDNPRPLDQWDAFTGRPHVVILEGWCVGAIPQDEASLALPVNALERDCDSNGEWRTYVNRCLAGRYQDLFAMTDVLVMLRSPGFERIAAWRQQQEDELANRSGSSGTRVMSKEEVRRFVAHFERITRHMLVEMPLRANLVLNLDRDRRICSVVPNGR